MPIAALMIEAEANIIEAAEAKAREAGLRLSDVVAAFLVAFALDDGAHAPESRTTRSPLDPMRALAKRWGSSAPFIDRAIAAGVPATDAGADTEGLCEKICTTFGESEGSVLRLMERTGIAEVRRQYGFWPLVRNHGRQGPWAVFWARCRDKASAPPERSVSALATEPSAFE